VARSIHFQSRRSDRPFLAVNCGALPRPWWRASCSGTPGGRSPARRTRSAACSRRPTRAPCFLDEIGELPPSVQVKLLRVLQQGEVRRVGANQPRLVDVRVIAATNRDLVAALRSASSARTCTTGSTSSRSDLPPLRERREDIPVLALYFLTRYAHRLGKELREFTPRRQAVLLRYDYPGNVRELENAVQRAATLAEGSQVQARDLPPWMLQTAGCWPSGPAGRRAFRRTRTSPWRNSSGATCAHAGAPPPQHEPHREGAGHFPGHAVAQAQTRSIGARMTRRLYYDDSLTLEFEAPAAPLLERDGRRGVCLPATFLLSDLRRTAVSTPAGWGRRGWWR